MSRPTPQAEIDGLSVKIRALKQGGMSYDKIGKKIKRNGKPIGRTTAQIWARRQEGECSECLRPFVGS